VVCAEAQVRATQSQILGLETSHKEAVQRLALNASTNSGGPSRASSRLAL
jgi:hypothetical protein